MQERQVVVNGLLTSYLIGGEGATLLLLHGWGDSKETFRTMIDDLSKKFKIIAPDLPGFGKSQAPHETWGLDEYAAHLQNFLVKTEQKTSAVIAHSNGASVAIRGLANDVLQADKVVLMGAAGIRNRQKGKRLALKVIAKSGKAITFWLPIAQKQRLRKRLYGVAGSDMLIAPHLQETFKRTVRQDVQVDAARLSQEVLLVYGEQDRATPPLYGRIYEEIIPHAQLEIVADAGHFVHQDAAKIVTKTIVDFLK